MHIAQPSAWDMVFIFTHSQSFVKFVLYCSCVQRYSLYGSICCFVLCKRTTNKMHIQGVGGCFVSIYKYIYIIKKKCERFGIWDLGNRNECSSQHTRGIAVLQGVDKRTLYSILFLIVWPHLLANTRTRTDILTIVSL